MLGKSKVLLNFFAWSIAFCAIIFIWASIDSYGYLHQLDNEPPYDAKITGNGIWMRYRWYYGQHSDKDMAVLCERLLKDKFKYVYWHVRETDGTGKLTKKNDTYKEIARKLNAEVHKQAPGVKSIAWVYVPSGFVSSGVNLTIKQNRQNLINEALWLTKECGFDGVQWDYEFFPSGETTFPTLLDETRAAIGKDSHLSTCAPMWYPNTLWGWNDDDFKRVAGHCDQICVMDYDSFFYYPRSYVWLMKENVARISRDMEGTDTKVVFGFPVYDDGTLGHSTVSENVVTSLAGIREGLADPRTNLKAIEGIAPFAEYTMEDGEWQRYRKWWLGRVSVPPDQKPAAPAK